LLEVVLDGDDPLRAGHLELQVGVVGDGHEFGEERSTEEVSTKYDRQSTEGYARSSR
jgi:hypothetical protein